MIVSIQFTTDELNTIKDALKIGIKNSEYKDAQKMNDLFIALITVTQAGKCPHE